MGLTERRAAKQFETNRLPALTKEIHGAAGFEVPLEVHWDAIATEGSAEGGVLTIDRAPTTNAHQVDERTRAIREALEKAL